MKDNAQDMAEPTVELVFSYDSNDDEVKAYLAVDEDEDEEEVEISDLTPEEGTRRIGYEEMIQDGLVGFFGAGSGLNNIKSQKLFRSTHKSFAKYCKDEWGISRFHATRLIAASKVAANLQEAHQLGAVSMPPTEAAARVITDLPKPEQIKVAEQVKKKKGNRKPNAKDFQEAKEEVFPSMAPKSTPKNEAPRPIPLVTIQTPPTTKFPSPSEYHQGIFIPSLRELSDKVTTLSNIARDQSRKAEVDKLLCELKKWLHLYAEWQADSLGAPEKKEAA